MSKSEQYIEAMKQGGFKATPQRLAVLELLLKEQGNHLSCEDIHAALKSKHPDMGLATVYRTVLLFENLGIVHRLELDNDVGKYELNRDGGTHRHHHLICRCCGKVFEFDMDYLDVLEQKIYVTMGFSVEDHKLKFYGVCESCRKKTQ